MGLVVGRGADTSAGETGWLAGSVGKLAAPPRLSGSTGPVGGLGGGLFGALIAGDDFDLSSLRRKFLGA